MTRFDLRCGSCGLAAADCRCSEDGPFDFVAYPLPGEPTRLGRIQQVTRGRAIRCRCGPTIREREELRP